MQFDATRGLDKPTMIGYFRDNLKPFIKVEMKQQNQASIDFDKMI